MTEAELQQYLQALIDSDELLKTIEQKDAPSKALAALRDPNFFPTFPIDFLLRKSVAEAAETVLERLTILEKVSSSTKSVSMSPGESLFPDLLYVNPESASLVLFELKRDKATSRQTTTELLAYEHELQNHLPFIDSSGICFVVVATEFPTLLDHSIASLATWHRKRVLCLLAELRQGRLHLSVHLPSCWTAMGQLHLPRDGVQTVQLCPYPTEGMNEETSLAVATTAMQMICHDGEQNQGHGFAILLQDAWYPKVSQCPFVIMVGAINPFAFTAEAVRREMLRADASPIIEFLLKDAKCDDLTAASGWVSPIGKQAATFLEQYGAPHWEGFSTWTDERRQAASRWIPITAESWGFVGQYGRDISTRLEVLKNFMPELAHPGVDWTHPRFAVRILDQIALRPKVEDGKFGCRSMLHLGAALLRLATLASSFRQSQANQNPVIQAGIFWAEVDLIPLIGEVRLRYIAAKDLEVPPPKLQLGDYAKNDVAPAIKSFCDWIVKEFIGKRSPIHLLFFKLGADFHFVFEESLRSAINPEQVAEAEAKMVKESKLLLKNVVCTVLSKEIFPDDRDHAMELLRSKYGLDIDVDSDPEKVCSDVDEIPDEFHIAGFSESLPGAVDSVFPQLFHDLAPMAQLEPDWEWLKQQIKQFSQSGASPMLVIGAGGEIGTGFVPPICPIKAPTDLDKEVLVYRDESFAGIFSVMT